MKILSGVTEPKDVSSKEYVDSIFDTLSMIAAESMFVADVSRDFHQYEFDYICIELLDSSDDIDITVYDGASILTNYYISDHHLINKTSTDTLTLQSKNFPVESIPYKALVRVDYDGEGTVTTAISKNNGSTWFNIDLDTLTDLDGLVQKNIRVRLTLAGPVRVKNIAWGIK